MNLLDRLLGHDVWTTGRLLAQARALSEEQLDQPFELGWRTVRATLEHIVDNMETWTDLMSGVPPREQPGGPVTLDEVAQGLNVVGPQLAAFARRMQAEGRLDDTWVDVLDVPPRRKTYGGGIAHVITHSMHHRAQLIHMLRALGVPHVEEGGVLGWEAQVADHSRAAP
ncbi:DinB family protein [Deinococcus xianganensis]|uniref:DinB family protein n=1 Tax=Deinococcus xianganensis TaxID=1507289 RepID=A0A6I4YLI2_9DEIO|nr:DinB family protein [Deinococcus xianganensis]MXV18425.1 DinB family protein [Deinococcus xianganensis]